MDSNYPDVTLTAAALILGAADRVRWEGLTVMPDDGVRAFEVDGKTLRVPGFGYLGGELLHAAVTGGPESQEATAYVDSVLGFVGGDGRLAALRSHRAREGRYPTTEASILEGYAPHDAHLPEETGLRLVLEACDRLEAQAFRQGARSRSPPEAFARMPARQAR
jgi:hypothetical protein